MENIRESKTEASIPAATRVDIRTLAMLSDYWADAGVQVVSVSQLINWSLEALIQVLRRNEKIGREIESIYEAEVVMSERGLVQRSMMRRGHKKLTMAKGFQELRIEGEDPRSYAREAYNTLHNRHTIQPPPANTMIHEAKKQLEDEKEDLIARPTDSVEEMTRKAMRVMELRKLDVARVRLEETKRKIKELPVDENGCVIVEGAGQKVYMSGDVNRDNDRVNELKRQRDEQIRASLAQKNSVDIEELERDRAKRDAEQLEELKKMNDDFVKK